MSTHCSKFPNCGCPNEIGLKCHVDSPPPELKDINNKPFQEWANAFHDTMKMIMAPHGYKPYPAFKGAMVVTGVQVYTKERIERAVIQAVTVHLKYRQLVQKNLDTLATLIDAEQTKAQRALNACKFWQRRKIRDLKRRVDDLEIQMMSYAQVATMMNQVQPADLIQKKEHPPAEMKVEQKEEAPT